MATNWPTSVDAPHDPVSGESMASGQPGDLAQEITNANDRTVAMQSSVGVTNSPGGMGFKKLISRTVLASAVTSVTFSSIPQTYENLVLEVMGRTTQANTVGWILLQYNGDVGTVNYASQNVYGNGTAAQAGVFAPGTAGMLAGFLPGASDATANQAGCARIVIPSYARTTFAKTHMSETLGPQSWGATNSLFAIVAGGVWNSTAAITSLTLVNNSTGNFVTGSVFSLYGEG